MPRLGEAAADHLDDDRIHSGSVFAVQTRHDCALLDERSRFLVCSAIIDRSLLTNYEAEDVLVVRDPEQLRALGGEVRSRIITLLNERAASTTELAGVLGIAKGTVAHHLKVLERAGLIRVVATRQIRAVTERYYGRVARLFVLQTDDTDKSFGGGALAAVMLRNAAEEILPADVETARVTAGLTHARLRPADARRLSMRLNKIFAAISDADDPEGEPYGLAAALYPAIGALPKPDGDA
jgi:DNA-binding transcriptional ArsR family regulator